MIVSSAREAGSSVDFGVALVMSSSVIVVGVSGVASGCLVGGVSDPTVEGCDGASWLERPASPDPSLGAPEVAAGPPPNPLRDNVPVGASLLQAESSSATANEVASSTPLMLGASVNVSKGMSNRGYSTNLEYAMRAAHSTIRLCLAPGFVEVHEPQCGSGFTGCIGEGHGRVCETFASNWAGPQRMPWSTRLSGHPGISSRP